MLPRRIIVYGTIVHSRSSSGAELGRVRLDAARVGERAGHELLAEEELHVQRRLGEHAGPDREREPARLADVEDVDRGLHPEAPHLGAADRVGSVTADGVERRVLEADGLLVPQPGPDDLLRHVVRRQQRAGAAGAP